MEKKRLCELEIERRKERGHLWTVIAWMFCVSNKRLRWDARRELWLMFNAISGRFSEVSDVTVGAMIGAFVITTGKAALGGSADADAQLANPDWASIVAAVRVLLSPESKFLTAPATGSATIPSPANVTGDVNYVTGDVTGEAAAHEARSVRTAGREKARVEGDASLIEVMKVPARASANARAG